MEIAASRERELVVAAMQGEVWKLVREVKSGRALDRHYLRSNNDLLNTITISKYSFHYLIAKTVIELEKKESESKEVYRLRTL